MGEYVAELMVADVLLGGDAVRERVVRCRECEHWGGLWDWDEAIGCDLADLPQADPDGFCAWGERRDDAQM
ncbi:hypothetical protein [Olsenella profusa]|uniref:Uncharacterized protein n=1 Tax=Olsenella profusa F0195 TaxID=1125712 RepID=U2T9Y5_9ACTN|nr:hypothetical protein [Olsenella profusa]ERL09834.1 hypothetical protein HMPREF1316_1531 [Olsenella profusa F0195]